MALLVVGAPAALATSAAAAPAPPARSVDTVVRADDNPFNPWWEDDEPDESEAREGDGSGPSTAKPRVTPSGVTQSNLAATGFDAAAFASLGLFLFAVGLGLVRLTRPRGPVRAR